MSGSATAGQDPYVPPVPASLEAMKSANEPLL
jgi:hypothetical protein